MKTKNQIDSLVKAIIADNWREVKEYDSVAYYFDDYIENTGDVSTFTEDNPTEQVLEEVEDFNFKHYNWLLGFLLTLESDDDSHEIGEIFNDLADLEARFEYESEIDPRYHSYTAHLWFNGEYIKCIK